MGLTHAPTVYRVDIKDASVTRCFGFNNANDAYAKGAHAILEQVDQIEFYKFNGFGVAVLQERFNLIKDQTCYARTYKSSKSVERSQREA